MSLGRYADLAADVRARPARLGPVRLVAVDGPSGAGKSRFAARLAAALGGSPVVRTDDLLDGWEDQLTFWPRLESAVLEPLRQGRPAHYQRYDWQLGRFAGAPVAVAPAAVVVLEGVSAARAAIRPELTLAVFVTAPDELCLARSLARDGAELRPHLQRWQRVERRHFAADGTVAAADLVVDGTAPDQPERAGTYVRLPRRRGPGSAEG